MKVGGGGGIYKEGGQIGREGIITVASGLYIGPSLFAFLDRFKALVYPPWLKLLALIMQVEIA